MSSDHYVTLAEVKEMLDAEAADHELTPEQRYALDQVNKNVKVSASNAQKLVQELRELPFVSEAHAVKVADIMPTHVDDVRVLFAKERSTVDKKQLEQIIKLVEKYL
jgi:DNA-directed RNA polymerase subunit F